MCDFWARVKLKKTSVNELAQEAFLSVRECNNPGHTDLDDALIEFWTAYGVKNAERLSQEEPYLYSKMKLVNAQVKMQFG
ncbi:MAG: hypothetical protein ACXADD_10980 [Candidatus Thorarchaeota archaeon]|jgi:hypothetical protein